MPPQLEKNHGVPTAWQDEALARDGVSRESMGFPGGSAGKELACSVGDLGSIPGIPGIPGKIPWRRERLPTPVFWSGEFHGLYSPWGRKELDMTESSQSNSHIHT